jgi:hypothetical protein
MNYLLTIPGVNGVPLSYVVREKEVADPLIENESFNKHAIAGALATYWTDVPGRCQESPSTDQEFHKPSRLSSGLNATLVARAVAKTRRPYYDVSITAAKATRAVALPLPRNFATPSNSRTRNLFSS